MTIVGIKEARRTIGRLISRAEQGEEILISRRGRQIAKIQGLSLNRPMLPLLKAHRESITISGTTLSKTVIKNRSEERA